jgi:hypothetical protein
MKKFIGLTLLVGLIKVPRLQLYWANETVFSTPLFRASMDRDRYLLLMKFWHFENNEVRENTNDRLYKIRHVLEYLNQKFAETYFPSENISLDESLLLFKGRLMFKQYIPLKRSRYGIKQYIVAENTGYVYRMKVYTGKDEHSDLVSNDHADETAEMTKTDKLVICMMSGLLQKGYKLFVDNFYTSTKLFAFLDNKQANACGTIRKNRLPPIIRNAPVKKGEYQAWRSGNLLCIKYHDRKEVFLLSTMHDEASTEVRKVGRHARNGQDVQKRPNCVITYNHNMGGVDRLDQVFIFSIIFL